MPVPTDITAGTLTITNGSTAVTGTGTAWLASDLRQGDIILWIEGGDGFQTPILADVPSSNTALTLVEPWEGPTLTGVRYRIRYQWDSSRVSAQSRQLIEMLDNGNVLALSGLTGPGVPVFDGPHSMVVRPETDFINGVAYDVQVDTLADRVAYDGQAEGFAVLVSDVGDGRSALYSKVSNAVGDWSDPAYITGRVGPTPDIEATVTNTAPGTAPTVTPVPITGGTRLDFTLPEAEGFYNTGPYNPANAYVRNDVVTSNGSTFIALQAVPPGEAPSGAYPPVDTPYWAVLAAKGQDGEIDGVTPFWQSRILNDADAAAARAGLELVKQTSATDNTDGRLLTVGGFGVGKTAVLVAPNLNDTRPSGRYYCNSPTNGPAGEGNGWLEFFDLDVDYAIQVFRSVNNGREYTNRRFAGAWLGWRLETTESGSNANGFYTVFGDGTKIAWGNNQRTLEPINASFAGIFRSTGLNVTLPITFTSGRLFLTPGPENVLGVIGGIQTTSVTSAGFGYVAMSGVSTTVSFSMNWLVIGK